MDIQEMKVQKNTLEKIIQDQIREFERKTGTELTKVDWHRVEIVDLEIAQPNGLFMLDLTFSI